MKIINKTKNVIIANEAVLADTLLKRIKGLLGKKEFRKGEALIIEPCNSIHTFFMRFPIDLLFVDRNNKIVKIKHSIRPFHITPLYLDTYFVIELPSGSIQSTSIQEGDTLSIID